MQSEYLLVLSILGREWEFAYRILSRTSRQNEIPALVVKHDESFIKILDSFYYGSCVACVCESAK